MIAATLIGGNAFADDDVSKLPGGLKPTHFDRYVPSGVEQKIGYLVLVNPDCSPVGSLTPRVLVKPDHGDITFTDSEDFASWSAPNPREKCSDKKYASLRINYKSNDGYVGEDAATVLMITKESAAILWQFSIDVR